MGRGHFVHLRYRCMLRVRGRARRTSTILSSALYSPYSDLRYDHGALGGESGTVKKLGQLRCFPASRLSNNHQELRAGVYAYIYIYVCVCV